MFLRLIRPNINSKLSLLFNSNQSAPIRNLSSINLPSNLINSKISVPIYQSQRNANFFNRLSAEQLWKGVTSVSNAGKKRGRGKGVGKKLAKNLNRGQIIGVGKENIIWPGLNAPIIRGNELVQQVKLEENKEREEELIKLRDQQNVFRRNKLTPLERGWSGGRMPGRKIGPPDAIGEATFEGFESIVLEMKMVFTMKGNMGRKRRQSAMVATGNKNGLIGFAIGKGIESQAAVRKAKNRAAQKLIHVPLYNNHTVFHDFFCQFGKTKIFVSKKQEGYGLVCHRAIKSICELIGIKDLYAKVEGSTNLQHIIKAFMHGILQQKTHQELAEEKKLHLVEFKKEDDNFPRVVASPSACRTLDEIPPDEVLDFTQHVMNNKVILPRKKWVPFYTKLPSYQKHLNHLEKRRGLKQVKVQLMAQYGELRSFMTDKYPECRPPSGRNKS